MSKWMDKLKALAGEPDEAKRVELAGAIDKEADELDGKWADKEAFSAMERERDEWRSQAESAGKERDDWKMRYADRFFGQGSEPGSGDGESGQEPGKPVKIGVDGLWQ